jgi:hypothetical protein
MAIVSFGTTIRGNTAIGIKNVTSNTLMVGFLRAQIPAAGVKFVTFNQLDPGFRYNPRNSDEYSVNVNNKPFLDDVGEFAALIKGGSIQVYLTTQPVSSTTYTLGASAAFTTTADGSVAFS